MLQTMERLFYLSLTYPPSQVAASRIADRGRSRKVGSLREKKRCTRRTFDDCLPYGNLALYKEGDRRGSNPRPSEPQSDALPTELRPPSAHEILPGKGYYGMMTRFPTPGTRSFCRPLCLRPRS